MIPAIEDSGNRSRPGRSEIIAVVWRYGDSWGRAFLATLVACVALIVIASAWVAESVVEDMLSLDAALGYGVALTSAVLYLGAWNEPMYSTSVIEEYLRRGWWRSDSVPYYLERVRYLRTWGRKGRLPGSLGWGALAWALYLTLVASAVPFITSFPMASQSGRFYIYFVLTLSASFGFFGLSGVRNRRLHLEAEARGYALASLYPRRRKYPVPEER